MKLVSNMNEVVEIKNKSGKSSVFEVGDLFSVQSVIENTAKGYRSRSYAPEVEIIIFRGDDEIINHTSTFNRVANLLHAIEYKELS